jgi:hypothetical protein
MKHIKTFLSFLFISLLITSCDLLDLSPEDNYASGNFWKNEAHVEAFALGLHADLRSSYQSMMFTLGEARGGTQKTGNGSQGSSLDMSSPIKNNAFTKDLTGISSWMGLYSNILQVNHFIEQLEKGTEFLSADKRNYFLGQAYGLRAFYYFYLYRTFGGVPIITEVKILQGKVEAKNLYTPRATAKQTLDFIKEDINKSETAFGSQTTIKNKKAQWSYYATKMLKTEIYLWSAKVKTGDQSPATADLTTAETALQSVLSASQFELLPAYSDVFAYTNKGNKEVIFAVRYADGEASNFVHNFSYQIPLFVNKFYNNKGELITKDTLDIKSTVVQRHEYKLGLFNSYDDLDARKRGIFLDYYNKEKALVGTVVKKYNGLLNSEGNRSWSDDFVVYRYADAVLLMAEIKNMQNQSVATYINQIRQRAFGKNYIAATHGYTDGNFSANELAILHERDKEFVLEGKRWFDIRRMQQSLNGQPLAFSATANYDDPSPVIDPSKSYLLLWPIDINTLNNDPELKQTEGY